MALVRKYVFLLSSARHSLCRWYLPQQCPAWRTHCRYRQLHCASSNLKPASISRLQLVTFMRWRSRVSFTVAESGEDTAADMAKLSQLLEFGSSRELLIFWKRTRTKLEPRRVAVAMNALRTLTVKGIPVSAIKQYPNVLKMPEGILNFYLSELGRLHVPVRRIFPLLLLRARELLPAVKTISLDGGLFPGYKSRLDYLVDKLQTSYDRLCPALLKNPSILTYPAARIRATTELLIEGGVDLDAILDDSHIYKHNIAKMQERLAHIRQTGLQPIRPWMLRCPDSVLEEHIDRYQLRLSILSEHGGDEVTYLSDRLGVDRAEVSEFQRRYPPALRVSVMKMRDVLDVLLAYGYTGEQVAQQPRILCYSAKRIQARCRRLQEAGLRPSSLLVLCKTPQEFDRYMASLKPAEKKPPDQDLEPR